MADGGRIVAITYAPGAHKGSWQPYIAQGTAKAALSHYTRLAALDLCPRIRVNATSSSSAADANRLPYLRPPVPGNFR